MTWEELYKNQIKRDAYPKGLLLILVLILANTLIMRFHVEPRRL